MLSYETLSLLLQKQAPGDQVGPPFVAELFSIFDPRRAGTVQSHFVGPAAANAHIITFTVPRDGIYWIRSSIFARAGTARTWIWFVRDGGSGQDLTLERVVSVSGGWAFSEIMLLKADDLVRFENAEATIAGDEYDATIRNYELALA